MNEVRPHLFEQIFAGDTIYRVLFHRKVYAHRDAIRGVVIDVAGGGRASYYRYLPGRQVTSLNIEGVGADIDADFNQPLPLADASADAVLLFNAIYIAKDPTRLLRECRRILKPNGRLLLASPFISNEMRDPDDFERLTSQGLERLSTNAGFSVEALESFGERFTSAVYLLNPYLSFKLLRLIVYPLALALDRSVSARLKDEHPTPLGYFCVLAPDHKAAV